MGLSIFGAAKGLPPSGLSTARKKRLLSMSP
jgi:hypothetical protein